MKNINEKHKLIFFIYNYDYTVPFNVCESKFGYIDARD